MDSGTIMLWMFFGSWVGWAVFASIKGWSGTIVVGGGFIAACLVLIAGIPVTEYFNKSSNPENLHTAEIVQPKISQPVVHATSLGVTSKEFKQRFNDAAKTVEAPFHINKMNVENNKNGKLFKVIFNKHNVIFGTITEDGMIEGVTSISSGDGSIQSGLNMMKLSVILVRTLSPDLPMHDASTLVLDIMGENSKSPNAESHSKRVGGVEYFSMLSKELGYFFGAQIPEQK